MRHWLAKLAICTILLYNFFLNNDWAVANQLSKTNVQQLDPTPVVENLALANNFGETKKGDHRRFREIVKGVI